MQLPEFNLIDEPWIRVLDKNCDIKEVSLQEVILHAHEYVGLNGELPAQDVAVLRLLLAVLHTVFSRVNAKGEEESLWETDDSELALARWRELWDIGKFPEIPVQRYLANWHERFWLFHEDRPFYQVVSAKIGTEYAAAKLNGELSESSNKSRLFPSRTGKGKVNLSFAEAVRWLLFVNGYDDTSAKPKGKELPSPGVGWLGKLGLIYATGANLFETLMLNLTLLKDGEESWEEDNLPIWELQEAKTSERKEIALPDNQGELLTLQSRRLFLQREDGKVTGYFLLGGDFFKRENAFAEQMTVWSTNRAIKDNLVEYVPRRHNPTRQLWRDFGNFFLWNKDKHIPGVVCWCNRLAEYMEWNHKQMVSFRIASVQYGDKDFFVNDMFSDSLTFHIALLREMSSNWQARIQTEISRCDQLAQAIGCFAVSIAKAAGGEYDTTGAQMQLYDRIDQPFRQWLRDIDPMTTAEDAKKIVAEWQKLAQRIALDLANKMIDQSSPAAFVGRTITEENAKAGKKGQIFTAPKAYNYFCRRVYQIYKEE